MALVASITNRRPGINGGKVENFDLNLANGLSIIGMRLCHDSGKYWVDFPATQYAKGGELMHFAFLRATAAFRKELNRECLEMLGVIEKEPRLV